MENKKIITSPHVYEHPFGERVKMLMRLEVIFMQLEHYKLVHDEYQTKMYLRAFFALLSIAKRYDLRSLLLKELESVRNMLLQLGNDDNIILDNMQKILNELESCKLALHELDSKKIDAIRNIEFLNIIKLRSVHEIGCYLFETTELKHWLLQPAEYRQYQVKTWLSQLLAYEKTAKFMLGLLRDSAEEEEIIAVKGMYIKSAGTKGSSVQQLLMINVDEQFDVYPSISGDAYRYVIRFMEQKQVDVRAVQSISDINFRLRSCCI